MNKRKEYLIQCRYYKGEDKNPYNPADYLNHDFWKVENWWYKDTIDAVNGIQPKSPVADCLGLITTDPLIKDKWKKIVSSDNISITLFASLYQWWLHKNERPILDDFIKYYNRWKG